MSEDSAADEMRLDFYQWHSIIRLGRIHTMHFPAPRFFYEFLPLLLCMEHCKSKSE